MILPRRVLFVGAHCDDIELFGGGLLAHACVRGCEVGVLVFSDHRGVVDETTASSARNEFEQNQRLLALETGTKVVDHSDVMLPACRGSFERERGQIYAALEALRDRYDLVVTHPTTDTNQDHLQVAVEAIRVFKAHATVLGGEFPSNDVGRFAPMIYFALDEREARTKARMVAAYASQRFGGRPYLDEEVTLAALRLRGSQVRETWAEAYAVNARVVVRR